MEKTDVQPRITLGQAVDMLRLIDSQIVRYIRPASYEMSVEEFSDNKKLYELQKGLEKIISSHQDLLMQAVPEPLPALAAMPSEEYVEKVPPDNCWVLVDPDGQRYKTGDLQVWARENHALLGFQSPEDWKRICKGLRDVARFTVLGKRGHKTFRGWTVEQRPKEKLSHTARTWTLISPAGEIVQVYNLQKWVRQNALMFGAKDEKKIKQVCNKFQDIARSVRTGSNRSQSYKGWRVRA